MESLSSFFILNNNAIYLLLFFIGKPKTFAPFLKLDASLIRMITLNSRECWEKKLDKVSQVA